jgi:NTP pyrophosphatase (non-canonical NTP hydrolase)
MTLSEYLDSCLRTWANRDASRFAHVRNAALGIAGETGEIIEVVKKFLYHNKTGDECRVLANGEIGDLFYYLIVYMHERKCKLDEFAKVMGANSESWADIQAAVRMRSRDGDVFTMAMSLSILSGKLSAFTMNHISFGADDPNEGTTMAHVLRTAILIANFFSLDAEGIAKHNVEKLKNRHPQGWKAL